MGVRRMYLTPPIRRGCTVAAALVVATCSSAPAAGADGTLVTSATDCRDRVLEQPFRRWADPASYVLVDNGILEGQRNWALQGAAAAQRGNELFYVHAPDEKMSLALPPGSAARSTPVCVGVDYPTVRFFARN